MSYINTTRSADITVIDALMGTGKSTWIIDYLNNRIGETFNNPDLTLQPVLVVVPSLGEVDRFTKACPALDFRNPQPIHGRKLWGLKTLLQEGANIVTTHALFSMITPDINRLFKQQGYRLIVDEVLSAVETYNGLSLKDRDSLFRCNYVYVEPDTRRIRWNEVVHGDYKGRFDDVRKLCQIGSLVFYRDSVLIWEFPAEFLESFEQVFILTYMFEGSAMSAYLKAEGFEYKTQSLNADGELIDIEQVDESAQKAKLRELITIYEGRMNNIGTTRGKEKPLSSSWFKRATPTTLKKLKSSTENFFKKVAGTPAADNLWTTYKPLRSQLKGARYARQWIPNCTKATNDYIDRKSLAYLCNLFMYTPVKNYFADRGIDVDNDLYALSEMLQWIWRSQIRRGDPITLFIPSKRMRGLLQQWLESTNTVELVKGQTRDLQQAA